MYHRGSSCLRPACFCSVGSAQCANIFICGPFLGGLSFGMQWCSSATQELENQTFFRASLAMSSTWSQKAPSVSNLQHAASTSTAKLSRRRFGIQVTLLPHSSNPHSLHASDPCVQSSNSDAKGAGQGRGIHNRSWTPPRMASVCQFQLPILGFSSVANSPLLLPLLRSAPRPRMAAGTKMRTV